MTHFTLLIILPAGAKNIEETVSNFLHPYYSEIDVEPYKEYLDLAEVEEEVTYLSTLPKESLEKLAAELEVSSEDLEEIAKFNLGWYEFEPIEVDECGFYRMITTNPQGKWNWYSFIEAEPRESATPIRYPCRVADLPDVVPYAFITPDGQWYELGENAGIQVFRKIHLNADVSISEEEVNWEIKVRETLASYSDCLAVALDCHI